MTRVKVKPELLRWARERAGRPERTLLRRFPHLEAWERGEAMPTFKQLEDFARINYVPIGFLFLDEPPEERLPIPDFRTIGNQGTGRPSPDLLDTIYICQHRQTWFQEYARSVGEEPIDFVGSVRVGSPVERTAEEMRKRLGFDLDARRECSTWTDALRQFFDNVEEAGVLLMCNGVVHNNNHRKLDPKEFRGFAMTDDLAPVIFINGADTKAAQMFTLAHELAHLWAGETGLSDVELTSTPSNEVEVWCNRVAAEFLVPLHLFRNAVPQGDPIAAVNDLARRFKVSTLVILRRLLDAGHLSNARFREAFEEECARLKKLMRGSGGNFFLTHETRVSRRFAHALVGSVLEGQTLYRDAFRMLGISKDTTFQKIGRHLGYEF